MSVTLPYEPTRQTGAGVAVFPFEWGVISTSHLVVRRFAASGESTLLHLNEDYTAQGGQLGGSIELVTPLVSGEEIEISRATPRTQPADLRNQTSLSLADVEKALDRAVMIIQEQDHALAAAASAAGVALVPGLYSGATVPAESAGLIVRVHHAGEPEQLRICVANSDGSLGWIRLGEGEWK